MNNQYFSDTRRIPTQTRMQVSDQVGSLVSQLASQAPRHVQLQARLLIREVLEDAGLVGLPMPAELLATDPCFAAPASLVNTATNLETRRVESKSPPVLVVYLSDEEDQAVKQIAKAVGLDAQSRASICLILLTLRLVQLGLVSEHGKLAPDMFGHPSLYQQIREYLVSFKNNVKE